MENKLSEILDNILGLLLLEGSYDIDEKDEAFYISIKTQDAGRLIGFRGQTLESLQLIVNQLLSRQIGEDGFKKVILDIEGWKEGKSEELESKAKQWIEEVKSSGNQMELEPMPSWQRRVVHMVVSESNGVESESIGEGRDRYLVIRAKKPLE